MKIILALSVFALQSFAAEQTWTGQITDSMCKADHSVMSSGGKPADAHDCTLTCTKAGAKFAFVSNGKVFDSSSRCPRDCRHGRLWFRKRARFAAARKLRRGAADARALSGSRYRVRTCCGHPFNCDCTELGSNRKIRRNRGNPHRTQLFPHA